MLKRRKRNEINLEKVEQIIFYYDNIAIKEEILLKLSYQYEEKLYYSSNQSLH
jgi:hypothetical protein